GGGGRWAATVSARASARAARTSSGGRLGVGGTVECVVRVADPALALGTATGFAPSSTGPGGERTDVWTATAPGKGKVVYTLSLRNASITLTFKVKVVPA